jgi:hypothetical protein
MKSNRRRCSTVIALLDTEPQSEMRVAAPPSTGCRRRVNALAVIGLLMRTTKCLSRQILGRLIRHADSAPPRSPSSLGIAVVGAAFL